MSIGTTREAGLVASAIMYGVLGRWIRGKEVVVEKVRIEEMVVEGVRVVLTETSIEHERLWLIRGRLPR